MVLFSWYNMNNTKATKKERYNMPEINSSNGVTTFMPSPQEVILNNESKRRRREHDQLVYDMAEVKAFLRLSHEAEIRTQRKAHQSRGGY